MTYERLYKLTGPCITRLVQISSLDACSVENAAYDPSDWLGPWRGYISEKAKGPAGRALLAAAGVPPEEVPPAPARELVSPMLVNVLGVTSAISSNGMQAYLD